MKKPGLSGSALRVIAMAAMVLDHIGYIFLADPKLRDLLYGAAERGGEVDPFFNSPLLLWGPAIYALLRCVGGVAFPIFALLLTEGFLHTRSLKRYMSRIALFALLSEVPFDLAFYGRTLAPLRQNVCFTLLLGLAGLAALRYLLPVNPLLALGGALGCVLLAELLRTDYGGVGVAVILALYVLRDRRGPKLLAAGGLLGCYALSALWLERVLSVLPAMALLDSYNGERGRLRGGYFFYGFYPLHLLLLWWVRVLLVGG